MKNTTTQEITISTTLYASVNWLHTAKSRLWRSRHSRGASSASSQRSLLRSPTGAQAPLIAQLLGGERQRIKATGGQQESLLRGVPSWAGRKGTALWVVAGGGRCAGGVWGLLGQVGWMGEPCVESGRWGFSLGIANLREGGASWQQEHLCPPSPS